MNPELSIAISLKRMELKQNRDLQKWCCCNGFKDWVSSPWLAVRTEETKLQKELDELEKSDPHSPITEAGYQQAIKRAEECSCNGSYANPCKKCQEPVPISIDATKPKSGPPLREFFTTHYTSDSERDYYMLEEEREWRKAVILYLRGEPSNSVQYRYK